MTEKDYETKLIALNKHIEHTFAIKDHIEKICFVEQFDKYWRKMYSLEELVTIVTRRFHFPPGYVANVLEKDEILKNIEDVMFN